MYCYIIEAGCDGDCDHCTHIEPQPHTDIEAVMEADYDAMFRTGKVVAHSR